MLEDAGLLKRTRRAAGKTEDEIYSKLGLDWIPPELREARGEIALAREHRLPHFVEFFFQADDGIRDYKVTGVQTCALPISGTGAILSASGTTSRKGTRTEAARRTGRRQEKLSSDRAATRSCHGVPSFGVMSFSPNGPSGVAPMDSSPGFP